MIPNIEVYESVPLGKNSFATNGYAHLEICPLTHNNPTISRVTGLVWNYDLADIDYDLDPLFPLETPDTPTARGYLVYRPGLFVVKHALQYSPGATRTLYLVVTTDGVATVSDEEFYTLSRDKFKNTAEYKEATAMAEMHELELIAEAERTEALKERAEQVLETIESCSDRDPVVIDGCIINPVPKRVPLNEVVEFLRTATEMSEIDAFVREKIDELCWQHDSILAATPADVVEEIKTRKAMKEIFNG